MNQNIFFLGMKQEFFLKITTIKIGKNLKHPLLANNRNNKHKQ